MRKKAEVNSEKSIFQRASVVIFSFSGLLLTEYCTVLVHFPHILGYKTKANILTEKSAQTFLPSWLFSQKLFEKCLYANFATKNRRSFTSNTLVWYTSATFNQSPIVAIDYPKTFQLPREGRKKFQKKIICRGQVVCFSTSLGSRWLNTVPLPSDRWNINHKVFSFLPTLFVLHR